VNYCGMDIGKKTSHLCILDEERKIVLERAIATKPSAFLKALGDRPPMRIAIEASGRSFWIAERLEELGHEVVVVDPGRTKAIGSSLIKNDRLDARVISTLNAANLMAAVHRPTAQQRVARMPVTARGVLVQGRARLVNCVRGLLASEGIEARSCTTKAFAGRVREMELPQEIAAAIAPVLDAIEAMDASVDCYDETMKERSKADPVMKRLQTANGVGPIAASCFVAAIHDPRRFRNGDQVAAYLGLVPSLYASGATHRSGGITKRGNRQARWSLTMAANVLLRGPKESALRTWGLKVIERQGRKKAVVAVARKLAGILWRMWIREEDFKANPEPRRLKIKVA
jgi:transposase